MWDSWREAQAVTTSFRCWKAGWAGNPTFYSYVERFKEVNEKRNTDLLRQTKIKAEKYLWQFGGQATDLMQEVYWGQEEKEKVSPSGDMRELQTDTRRQTDRPTNIPTDQHQETDQETEIMNKDK